MNFGESIGEACATFAITNIDDMFVLVTFYAEASTSRTLSAWKITLGQLLGFTVIIIISMIGFGVSLVLPPEPIGFLGLLPILLGLWNFAKLFQDDDDDDTEITTTATLKGIFKVALVTLMNGGDNIGTYIPLFSQIEKSAIAIYIVTYYILLFLWCLAAYLVMRQRHILAFVQKYVEYLLPLLYIGLGIFILIKSKCYPWAIEKINESTGSTPGEGTLAGVTTFILLVATCAMAWYTVAKRKLQDTTEVDLGSELPQVSPIEAPATQQDTPKVTQ
ncbi:hypothetical protein VHEMI08072 [[Torrubiella] hemipterigena]|uniref:Cadmium resistance transporter n=1 Tax=[Torrubiella] hemipterigena TaxID=1531966 RepID=A0A0A1TMS9_9HYPO|nr:hypothetical protein VHEMI08072 [[Torrubiella] hemipterigena]